MARQRYDIGSKWLLQNQGKGALLVGGLENVRSTEPMPGEVVQNRRYPDGLLRAFLGNDSKPHHVIQGKHEVRSELGLARLEVEWRTVELWTLSAARFLDEADVGVMPWVPLMSMAGKPERILERCVERIEREAPAGQRGDLLAIAEVMAGLTFAGSDPLTLFQGKQIMIESPVIKRWQAEALHKAILAILTKRYKKVPRDVIKPLCEIQDGDKLTALTVLASECRDLDAFRAALSS